jgi:formyltetrahydrofolate deformylase
MSTMGISMAITAGTRMSEHFALTLSCPNRPGIVAAVARALFDHGADILEAHQFDDVETGGFFARIRFCFVGESFASAFQTAFAGIATSFTMQWTLHSLARRHGVLLLVSRYDHCLADLLYRWRMGELAMDIVGIIANHPRETYRHNDFEGIAFDYLPVTAQTRSQQEAQIWRIISERKAELVVLARYMQILSQELTAKLSGRCINIHHSFLPGFKGGKPYHQAHARGVKLIGATAHYVTEDLDEGPIIEQDVETVSHYDTPEMLASKGRDIERRVLSRAVAWHLEGRVLLNGIKTVVFKN